MWCDSFDADLLKVVPGAVECLGDAAAMELTTYSWPTSGKINCPSCWNTYEGLAAFFWTSEEGKPDPSFVTDSPEMPCTLLEAVRDEFVHGALLVIDHETVWRPPSALMTMLMYDLRGWGRPLTDARREEAREHVRASLRAAAERLSCL